MTRRERSMRGSWSASTTPSFSRLGHGDGNQGEVEVELVDQDGVRVFSIAADPTPALSSGTALMISFVPGAAVTAMPAPSTANAAAIAGYGVLGVSKLSNAKPAAMSTRPTAITRAAPKRAASVALTGESA